MCPTIISMLRQSLLHVSVASQLVALVLQCMLTCTAKYCTPEHVTAVVDMVCTAKYCTPEHVTVHRLTQYDTAVLVHRNHAHTV
jgi:hypothetical protein